MPSVKDKPLLKKQTTPKSRKCHKSRKHHKSRRGNKEKHHHSHKAKHRKRDHKRACIDLSLTSTDAHDDIALSTKESEISRDEFLNALDNLHRDDKINTSSSLMLQQLKYKHFIQYIDGWFTLYDKSHRISIINESPQRINIGYEQCIHLVMDNDAYLTQKKHWNIQFDANQCNSLLKCVQIVSTITSFIKHLPTSFTSIYPSPLEFDEYSLKVLPSNDALHELIQQLRQIKTWHLLQRESNTFKQIEYFLKFSKYKKICLETLLYSPLMSCDDDEEVMSDYGIPPDEFCFINYRKRKASAIQNDDIVYISTKKMKVQPKDDYRSKYNEMQKIAKHLYNECVNGEKPRWDLIEVKENEYGVKRDSQLYRLKMDINALYCGCVVEGTGKWKGNKSIEKCIKEFVELNGEYNINAKSVENIDISNIIAKYEIDNHCRIPQLNGQNGLMALMDIPNNMCLGQYIGSEFCRETFGTIFDGTGHEYDHNVYAFDQQIDVKELKKIMKLKKRRNISCSPPPKPPLPPTIQPLLPIPPKPPKPPPPSPPLPPKPPPPDIDESDDDDCEGIEQKWFVIDPLIGDWQKDDLLVVYVNDCRCDISLSEPTEEDQTYFNVEFVGVKVNGWPQTYLISRRDIEKGEELLTFYGSEFSHAITLKMQNEQEKVQRKRRIDDNILKGFKL